MIDESQMTLGSDYHGGVDPTDWPLSEKMHGCRAYWDGSQFWTRGGNVIAAPDWFMDVQYGHWTHDCRFVAFDAPEARGPWQRRMAAAGRLWRDTVAFEVCQGHGWLMERLRTVQGVGGEGLMIRNPAVTGYETGRTANLLKVKTG